MFYEPPAMGRELRPLGYLNGEIKSFGQILLERVRTVLIGMFKNYVMGKIV